MRPDEMIGTGDALGEVVELVADTTRDVHEAIANRVFRATGLGLGPAVTPSRTIHDTITSAVYAGVRTGVGTAVRAVSRLAAATTGEDADPIVDDPRGAALVGAVNGIVGDRLAELDNPLDLGLELRHDGRPLAPTRDALADAYPDATGRLAVFVHGLCETEAAWHYRTDTWHRDDLPTHGDRLRRDLGFTPVWVRCNTGRRISENGADLDTILAALADAWPVEVTEIVLVGHSMGGLIARSAAHQGHERAAGWVDRVRHVVCLGAPHHGAPLEKLTNVGTWALGLVAESRPFATFLNRRSVGIKDLRYGNVTDADWRDRDPDALLEDARRDGALVDGIRYHVIGAGITPGPVGHLVGDALVRMPSATGRHRHRPLAFHGRTQLVGLHHFALLNHPAVYEHLREALR